MTKLIEQESVERDYGFKGINAIVETNNGHRFLICDGFGGINWLAGGAVRWRHGAVYELQPDDTFESLRAEQWNDELSLFEAVIFGCDDSRPVFDINPVQFANEYGLA